MGGITIVIKNLQFHRVIDGSGWVHPDRKRQYLALFTNVLKKYKLPDSTININISDHPQNGYFNFCRQTGNSKQFLIPNHRFTEDDTIPSKTFDETISYLREKHVPYDSRKAQFYTNCVPHLPKVDYFKYALKNQQICSGYVYGGSTHKYLNLPIAFVQELKAAGLAGETKDPFDTHNNYKYVIYNDGNTLSDRMRLLLCTDAVIVKKHSPYEEFFSYLLKPNINYIEYKNVDELQTVYNTLESDPTLCATIRRNNAEFVDTYLKYDVILEYVANLINALYV
jgi:hypothetical protein